MSMGNEVVAHTPGPWVYAPAQDDDGSLPKVTTVAWCADFVVGLPSHVPGGNYRDGDPSGDPEADARLIAAAPDLLASLREMVAWYGRRESASTHLSPADALLPADEQEHEVRRAMEAIAKATGSALAANGGTQG